MRPSPRKGGFTLLELMAALVAGLVAISAIYAVSSGSARHFQEQQRIAQTQMSLRMAMTQLRADVQRAGLFGAPNSDLANPPNLQGCPRPSPRIVAVEHLDSPNVLEPTLEPLVDANPGIEFDRLRLVGNYATTGSYLMIGAVTPNQVRLQGSWQGFRRDFFYYDADADDWTVDQDALEAAFFPGRILHVRTLQETSVFTPISAIVTDGTGADVRVNVGTPMPVGSPCMAGLGDGATVAPLSRIEYAVVDPNEEADLAPLRNVSASGEAEAALGLSPSVLVRREVGFDDGDPIPGTTRVVLEYVADFEVSFVVDTTPDAERPTLAVVTDGEAEGLANPERIRSVLVRLSVRTPGTTPRFAALERDPDTEPLTRFVVPGAPGAARVRTVETEIFLPNLVPAPTQTP